MKTRSPRPSLLLAAGITAACVLSSGCSSYRDSDGNASVAEASGASAQTVINNFRQKDPSLSKFFDSAYGYAVFPKIAKGAAGVGAANGDGVVYEKGARVGTSEMTQVTIGFQLGGQTYSEIIFFQNKWNLDSFKSGNFEFSANASAIAKSSRSSMSMERDQGIATASVASDTSAWNCARP